MLHEFLLFFMRPERTNSVEKYGNASRLKKKSAMRPTLPYVSFFYTNNNRMGAGYAHIT